MTRFLFALAVMALAAGPSAAQDIATRPYVFAQQHNGHSQSFDPSHEVQVQLPSNEGTWTVVALAGVTLTDTVLVPSPNRIPGFTSLAVFTFAPDGAPVAIKISASDLPPGDVADLVPDGVYSLVLTPSAY